MDTIAIPVRFDGGAIKTIQEGSDEYYAHLLAFALQTEKGELILNPTFGILDPVFDDDLTFQLSLTAAQYVPEVSVTSIVPQPNSQGQVGLKIIFERNEQ
jgi:hypothetical protein